MLKCIKKSFDSMLTSTTSVVETASGESNITNIQCTFQFVKPTTNLPLIELALHLSAAAKYIPSQFSAINIRVSFGVHITTCTVFESGKIIVVGAISLSHSLFASQMYRQWLSSFVCTFIDPKTKARTRFNLVNRGLLNDYRVNNIVACGNVGHRIKIKELHDSCPWDTSYSPGAFPGCALLIWVKPKKNCKCNVDEPFKKSCPCNLRSSIFDSGKFTSYGIPTLEHVNYS